MVRLGGGRAHRRARVVRCLEHVRRTNRRRPAGDRRRISRDDPDGATTGFLASYPPRLAGGGPSALVILARRRASTPGRRESPRGAVERATMVPAVRAPRSAPWSVRCPGSRRTRPGSSRASRGWPGSRRGMAGVRWRRSGKCGRSRPAPAGRRPRPRRRPHEAHRPSRARGEIARPRDVSAWPSMRVGCGLGLVSLLLGSSLSCVGVPASPVWMARCRLKAGLQRGPCRAAHTHPQIFLSEFGARSPRPKRWRTASRIGWGWPWCGSAAAERTAARGWCRNWFWSRSHHVRDRLAVGLAQVRHRRRRACPARGGGRRRTSRPAPGAGAPRRAGAAASRSTPPSRAR